MHPRMRTRIFLHPGVITNLTNLTTPVPPAEFIFGWEDKYKFVGAWVLVHLLVLIAFVYQLLRTRARVKRAMVSEFVSFMSLLPFALQFNSFRLVNS